MLNLTKHQINQNLVPPLNKGEREPDCKADLWRTSRAILYRMTIGVQWMKLPIDSRFGRRLMPPNHCISLPDFPAERGRC